MLGLLVLVVLLALGVGFRLLPWQWKLGVLGVAALLVLVLRERLLVWLFLIPFSLKGATLARASVKVHGITPTEKPPEPPPPGPDENEQTEPADPGPPRRYFLLDVTITPAWLSWSPFRFWEPGELALVGPGEDLMADTPADACVIVSHAVEPPACLPPEAREEYGYKVHGPHRVRLVIGVRPGVARLRFQYYFEKFGSIPIPPEGPGPG